MAGPTSRRLFSKQVLGALMGVSFFDLLTGCDSTHDGSSDGSSSEVEFIPADFGRREGITRARGERLNEVANHWLTSVNQICIDVKAGVYDQESWTAEMEKTLASLDLDELMDLINFDEVVKKANVPYNGAGSTKIAFPSIDGVPGELEFVRQIFVLGEGRAIVPHGHNTMVTSFLMLQGTFHGRHYERLEDQAEHLIIEPTIDRMFKPGDISSLNDFRDNIHWYHATEGPGYIFNIHVKNVVPDSPLKSGRVYVDPDGEDIGDGLIRAPLISSKEAHDIYG